MNPIEAEKKMVKAMTREERARWKERPVADGGTGKASWQTWYQIFRNAGFSVIGAAINVAKFKSGYPVYFSPPEKRRGGRG